MNAFISGSAGLAVVVDDKRVASLHAEEPGSLVPRTPREVRFLLGEARDVEVLERVDLDQVRARLLAAHREAQALDMVVGVLDAELTEETRRLCIEAAEELLGEGTVAEAVVAVLCACAQPEGVDLGAAAEVCARHGAARTARLLREVASRQPEIALVSEAWTLLPSRLFDDEAARKRARAACVRAGLFRDLVRALATGASPEGVAAVALLRADVRTILGHRDILQRWAVALSQQTKRPELVADVVTDKPVEVIPDEGSTLTGHQAFTRVQAQQAEIRHALQRRDFQGARRMIEELVSFQRTYGKPEHLAKSLRKLAVDAKRLGLYNIQFELTTRAVQVAPDDHWTWNHHGDALLQIGRLEEALQAYHQALLSGHDVVSKNGRAEVLKAMGKLDDALAAYAQASSEHPENVVAKNGRAEILKAMGKLDDALAAYTQASNEHPSDVVAKNGRAEVLKAMGRLDEALTAYEHVSREHPENVVAKNGRAEVLKAMGRLDEALTAYEHVSREHPENVVAKTGRAEVLKAMGRLDEALTAYEHVSREHPSNVVAKTGRAEVLKAMGRLDEALTAYEHVSSKHPENVVAKAGRAEVLKAMGRLDEALTAYEHVSQEHPENVVAKNGRAEALKAMGRLDEALTAYEQVCSKHPSNVVAKNGRAEVLKAMGRLDEALTAYEQVCSEHPSNVVAKNGRASVLALLGKTREALRALPSGRPRQLQEWVAEHIRGMLSLRRGDEDEAMRLFERGLLQCPFAEQRAYFRTSLAVARLQRTEYAKAAEVLALVEWRPLGDLAALLNTHAQGAQGRIEQAGASFARVRQPVIPAWQALAEEIKRRFVDQQPSSHSEDWLVQQEVSAILKMAA